MTLASSPAARITQQPVERLATDFDGGAGIAYGQMQATLCISRSACILTALVVDSWT